MQIKLLPQGRDDTTMSVIKSGDVLTINDKEYDLSGIPDGATLLNAAQATGCDLFAGSIERIDGELHVTLILPWPRFSSQPTIDPITVTTDGPITLPTGEVS